MSFDFSSLFWVFIVIMVLQPLFTARWYVVRRAQAIRAIEKLHGTRVITMIHRQEKRSLFGFSSCTAHRSGRCPDDNCGDQRYAGGYADRFRDLYARRPRAGSDADRPCAGST